MSIARWGSYLASHAQSTAKVMLCGDETIIRQVTHHSLSCLMSLYIWRGLGINEVEWTWKQKLERYNILTFFRLNRDELVQLGALKDRNMLISASAVPYRGTVGEARKAIFWTTPAGLQRGNHWQFRILSKWNLICTSGVSYCENLLFYVFCISYYGQLARQATLPKSSLSEWRTDHSV